ncbi:phosphatase PAP2 family protein [Sulfurimonas sp. HSL-3221]|uniref:phosphatase PAP2 family protein n=1 Tax=Sulfurimonadaceae TaxID=2771471 RepID=UPI001E2C2BAC|nr:phosphatase PAP2 family protein [Sulfurimonas sp. HSL-3221]UFS63081.1 phosphatase PAP2 family protein [Sulfurimonas sp. HSL-3221]
MKRTGRFFSLALVYALLSSAPGSATDTIERSGDALSIMLPLCAAAATAYHHDGEGALQFTEAFATTMGVTYALKYSIDKRRPDGSDQDAFPSGHTAAAFSGASFLQQRYGTPYGLPAYLAAVYVGWSRVEVKAHAVEDVLAGAAIGIIGTYLFTKRFKREMSLVPVVGNKQFGLVFQKKF